MNLEGRGRGRVSGAWERKGGGRTYKGSTMSFHQEFGSFTTEELVEVSLETSLVEGKAPILFIASHTCKRSVRKSSSSSASSVAVWRSGSFLLRGFVVPSREGSGLGIVRRARRRRDWSRVLGKEVAAG